MRVVAGVFLMTLFGATITRGVQPRQPVLDARTGGQLFRPDGFAFEPTARRAAVAERDAVLRAAYPRRPARRKNVVLIIVDSLRADRMQVYGYPRPTTPFPLELVRRAAA